MYISTYIITIVRKLDEPRTDIIRNKERNIKFWQTGTWYMYNVKTSVYYEYLYDICIC